jgi:hypothetical protein
MATKFAHNLKCISGELKYIDFEFPNISYIFSLGLCARTAVAQFQTLATTNTRPTWGSISWAREFMTSRWWMDFHPLWTVSEHDKMPYRVITCYKTCLQQRTHEREINHKTGLAITACHKTLLACPVPDINQRLHTYHHHNEYHLMFVFITDLLV